MPCPPWELSYKGQKRTISNFIRGICPYAPQLDTPLTKRTKVSYFDLKFCELPYVLCVLWVMDLLDNIKTTLEILTISLFPSFLFTLFFFLSFFLIYLFFFLSLTLFLLFLFLYFIYPSKEISRPINVWNSPFSDSLKLVTN